MKLNNLEPQAKSAVDYCVKYKAKMVMMVDGFITDKEALYLRDLLWYARNKGVEVTMVPHKEDK